MITKTLSLCVFAAICVSCGGTFGDVDVSPPNIEPDTGIKEGMKKESIKEKPSEKSKKEQEEENTEKNTNTAITILNKEQSDQQYRPPMSDSDVSDSTPDGTSTNHPSHTSTTADPTAQNSANTIQTQQRKQNGADPNTDKVADTNTDNNLPSTKSSPQPASDNSEDFTSATSPASKAHQENKETSVETTATDDVTDTPSQDLLSGNPPSARSKSDPNPDPNKPSGPLTAVSPAQNESGEVPEPHKNSETASSGTEMKTKNTETQTDNNPTHETALESFESQNPANSPLNPHQNLRPHSKEKKQETSELVDNLDNQSLKDDSGIISAPSSSPAPPDSPALGSQEPQDVLQKPLGEIFQPGNMLPSPPASAISSSESYRRYNQRFGRLQPKNTQGLATHQETLEADNKTKKHELAQRLTDPELVDSDMLSACDFKENQHITHHNVTYNLHFYAVAAYYNTEKKIWHGIFNYNAHSEIARPFARVYIPESSTYTIKDGVLYTKSTHLLLSVPESTNHQAWVKYHSPFQRELYQFASLSPSPYSFFDVATFKTFIYSHFMDFLPHRSCLAAYLSDEGKHLTNNSYHSYGSYTLVLP
ncbi:MAG: hypothetical protein OXC44_08305 [Proteobacteria bacterium]|nr:hypothetical protein [Pseudomonadota bacterium]